MMLPRSSPFSYEFSISKKWLYNDLHAPFNYALRKSPEQLIARRQEILSTTPIYVNKINDKNTELQLAQFQKLVEAHLMQSQNYTDTVIATGLVKYIITKRNRGILPTEEPDLPYVNRLVILEPEQISQPVNKYLTNANFLKLLQDTLSILKIPLDSNQLLDRITEANLTLNRERINKTKDQRLKAISDNEGMVNKDELVIARGEVISAEKFQRLDSLRREMAEHKIYSWQNGIGYAVVILMLMILYGVQLYMHHKEMLTELSRILLIMVYVLTFTGATSLMVTGIPYAIYNIPFILAPLVLNTFFKSRLAIMTHMLIILICALMVPSPFDFVLTQLCAGLVAIATLEHFRYTTRFFLAAVNSYITCIIFYVGLTYMRSSVISEPIWMPILWYTGSFALTLLVYPLIYLNERIFGGVSDIRLRELADINRPLLRELVVKAQGTFQHSVQVANLAETVVESIGGNSLLTRIGALYHDIGKLYKPEYFIENNSSRSDASKMLKDDGLSDVEHANLIIQHVSKGVELAEQNGLPAEIVDFIRTHHGTTRVEYFYRQHLKENENGALDENVFRYPGPKPQTFEQAILMMADSCEAASRSLKNPLKIDIENLIDDIIDAKLRDHQFDEANITLSQINQARIILKLQLSSIYHTREAYPDAPKEEQDF